MLQGETTIESIETIDSITAAERGVEKSDIIDLSNDLDGWCDGYLVRSFVGHCDSLKETCSWPCENPSCWDEGWKIEYEPLSRYDKGGRLGPALLDFAEAVRTDPEGVIDDSMAQLETVWTET